MGGGKVSMYAIVLAGGSGKRLWPLSRRSRPKQLLALPGPASMLESTLERLAGLIPPERTFVLTARDLEAPVSKCAGHLPAGHVIGEPESLGTAPAAALGGALVSWLDPQGTMVILPADHVIRPVSEFQEAVRQAAQLAKAGYLVTFGVRPQCPATGYGYIQRGARLPTAIEAYAVERFVEKPDETTACQFVAAGNYDWNSGMFAWTVASLHQALGALLPSLAVLADELRSALASNLPLGSERFRARLASLWSGIEDSDRTTIDYGIMERWSRAASLPVRFAWSDVGSWASLADLYEADEAGVVAIADHIGFATRDCLIHSTAERLVATIGVRDLIIVDTPDALLICHRDHAQAVKELVTALEAARRDDVL